MAIDITNTADKYQGWNNKEEALACVKRVLGQYPEHITAEFKYGVLVNSRGFYVGTVFARLDSKNEEEVNALVNISSSGNHVVLF